MSAFMPEAMVQAEQALESIREAWLQRPGVTAVDLGFKWTDGQMTNQLSIRVHVAQKKPLAELSPEERFPEAVNGIPVDVIEATYVPQLGLETQLEAAFEGRGVRFDDIPLGVSVGCSFTTAGTLGAKVFDLESGSEMILSNWHVLAGSPEAQISLASWQPGSIDGGAGEDNVIAELSRWVLGPYDAAVARLTGVRPVRSTTVEGRPIEDITSPRLGMMVWKSGRSTGYTEGFIDGVKMTTQLSYGAAGTRQLQDVFRMVPRPGAPPGEISIGGDSGSIWVDEASGKAVGLHFAGETGPSPEFALAHDITAVVSHLKIRFPGQLLPELPPPAGAPPRRWPLLERLYPYWKFILTFFQGLFRRR
ncbi:MAG: S1 family peptidase [Chloroflexi bacterium]|nr:S1 family peptidase [Chloroflexota bacterium]MCI0645404.1 S1 family peptidase [Chloroflexota bacterium]MCI0727205.1 S1 family peptidase [Chloroflexota bacterium]